MSLIHWWPLNGNTTDLGISPCTVSGAPAFAANGKIGKCLSSGTLTMPAAATAQVFNKDAVSVCFWLYNGGSAGCIFGTDPMTPPNNRRFTLFQYPTANDLHWSWQNEDSNGTFTGGQVSGAIPSNTWSHICAVWDNGTARMYVNGVQVGMSTGACTSTNWAYDTIIARPSSTRYYNDIRIYNHALSAKEVKEISKGLILHYNFEDNCQQLVNAYNEPTFNTSATSGGWGHWGSTGHAGSYAQNTDANYIYPGFSAYSHKVANGSSATKDYLLYQEKLFDGGYRSMQAIIKASDGAAITNSVCFPSWNGRAGGIANNSWTSIEPLGNGFYLCKAEGIKQTTSPGSANAHLVGIYVKPGKTIYVTCCYLENGKQLCSDIFDPNPKCYDCSGYGYNGTNNGVILSNDSISGKFSAQFASNAYIEIPSLPQFDKVTYSMWVKIPSNTQAYRSIFIPKGNPTAGGIWLSVNTEGVNLWAYQGGNTPNYCKGASTLLSADTWYLYTHTFDGTTGQNYLNGIAVGSAATYTTRTYIPRGVYTLGDSYTGTSWNGTPFDGKIADFKIYATVLSAEDILAEYNRKAAIDKKGNLFTGEFIESNVSSVKVDKANFIAGNNIVEGTDKVKFADKYTQLEYIQNTGTATISTGYQLDMDNDSVEIEFQATTTDQNGMILASSGGNYWWVYHYSSLINCYLDGTDGGQQNLSGPSRDTNKHTAVYQNKTYYVDNVAYNTASGTLGTTTQQLYFFAYNAGGSYPYKGKIYRCKIWNASQLVKDFIPAKRNSDNTIGMYDLVNRVFHAPTGSGTFTAGPEIGNISAIYANKIEEL